MKDILFINPPFLNVIASGVFDPKLKKTLGLIIEDIIMSSINVGILSLATYIKKKGFSFDILDMYKDVDFNRLEKCLHENDYRYIGISCVTGFSYPVVLELFSLIKTIKPEVLIIGGGMHLGPIAEIAMVESKDVDLIACYEGEIVLEEVLSGRSWSSIDGIVYRENGKVFFNSKPSKLVDLNELTPLAFQDYPNYSTFLPYIEESRGCYGVCDYCVNCFVNQGRIRFKDIAKIEEDIDSTFKLFGHEKNYLIESLNFGVAPKRTIDLLNVIKPYDIKWGVEFRADNPWDSYIDLMYEAGCHMFDVGIESASPTMLTLMNKTTDPVSYIKNASRLIKRVLSFPEASMSYNILFYVGETLQSLRETLMFIFEHQSNRIALSVFPVFLYPGATLYNDFAVYEKKYGARVVDGDYWKKRHIYPLDLSSELLFDEILVFSKLIQNIFGMRDHCIASSVLADDVLALRKTLR